MLATLWQAVRHVWFVYMALAHWRNGAFKIWPLDYTYDVPATCTAFAYYNTTIVLCWRLLSGNRLFSLLSPCRRYAVVVSQLPVVVHTVIAWKAAVAVCYRPDASICTAFLLSSFSRYCTRSRLWPPLSPHRPPNARHLGRPPVPHRARAFDNSHSFGGSRANRFGTSVVSR